MNTPLSDIDHDRARQEAHRLRNEAIAEAGHALGSLLRRWASRLVRRRPVNTVRTRPRLG